MRVNQSSPHMYGKAVNNSNIEIIFQNTGSFIGMFSSKHYLQTESVLHLGNFIDFYGTFQ